MYVVRRVRVLLGSLPRRSAERSSQTRLPTPHIFCQTSRMKRFLAPILLVTLLFPSLALGQAVTMDDLVITNGLYYKKFTNVPFTGEVTGLEQGAFKDGKADGPWISFNKDGTVDEKNTGTYRDGVKVE